MWKTISVVAAAAGFIAGAATSGSLWAGGHTTPPKFDPSLLDANLNAELTATIDELAAKWNSQDYSTVLEMWDPDQEVPFYLAEEQADWFIGWEPLRDYLDPPQPNPMIEAMRLQPSNVRAKLIAPDLAIAVWDLKFEMKMRFQQPIGEEIRVSGVLRKKPEGWRFIQYAESPKTAMVYLQGLIAEQIEPDFLDFVESVKKQ